MPVALAATDAALAIELVSRSRYNVSSQEVASYFTYAAARTGALSTAARVFELRFVVVAAPLAAEQCPRSLGPPPEGQDVCLGSDSRRWLPVCASRRGAAGPCLVSSSSASTVEAAADVASRAGHPMNRWHASVEVMDVFNASWPECKAPEGNTLVVEPACYDSPAYLGRLYLDAFPRADKFRHAAQFTL